MHRPSSRRWPSRSARFPIRGGLLQRRGGTARHDAIAWGYAGAIDAMGVDIIENCEVIGFARTALADRRGANEEGRRHPGQESGARRGGPQAARLAAMVDLRLPIETHVLQAMVSDPVKPVLDVVVSSRTAELYVSQSDKGELVMGGFLDGYTPTRSAGICRCCRTWRAT